MSIRIAILTLAVLFLAVYAWRDWFKSLCGLVLLTVFLEHGDMPRNILGIQGFNPWNVLLISILIPWVVQRRHEGRQWDLPRRMNWLFGVYLALVIVSYLRAAIDLGSLSPEWARTFGEFTSDEIFNPFKYMLPGIMMFDGCRTRERFVWGMTSIVLAGLGYAFLVLRAMPLSLLFDESGFMQHRHRINRDTGLDPNDIAMLFVGTFWATIAWLSLWRRWIVRILGLGAAGVIFVAMALCHSRAGYVSCAGVGLLFGLFRWRPLLAILPIGAVIVCIAMPSIPARLGMGFDEGDAVDQNADNWAEITSGRTTSLWPPVIDQIAKSPLFGWGRRGILRTGTYQKILETDGRVPGHPHNAYLETLLDAGVIGLLIVGALYYSLFKLTVDMCRIKNESVISAVSGMALAIVGALLITGLSSQSLFPTVSMMEMWCVCGMLLRISIMWRQQIAAQGHPLGYWQPSPAEGAGPSLTAGATLV
ncbi:MAG: O-antigen ligase family protein [Phycisphaerae bacterium]|nr:O-antigen ligase family protein [Phycisphaerae bacterium]